MLSFTVYSVYFMNFEKISNQEKSWKTHMPVRYLPIFLIPCCCCFFSRNIKMKIEWSGRISKAERVEQEEPSKVKKRSNLTRTDSSIHGSLYELQQLLTLQMKQESSHLHRRPSNQQSDWIKYNFYILVNTKWSMDNFSYKYCLQNWLY